MNKVPQEIDRIIWALAEANDPRAIEEFGDRYPVYREALVERIKLVRRLRSAKPTREVPPLRYQMAPRRPSMSRGLVFVFAGAALATLAFATVANLDRFLPQRAKGPVHTENPSEIAPFRTTGPSKSGDPEVMEPNVAPKTGSAPSISESLATSDPFTKSVTVDHEHVKLSSVIKEIGLQAGLKLEIAPGFPDQDVAARYVGVSAIEALHDLGQNFGFSVQVEEANHALIIPALDPSKPPVTVPHGSFSEPVETPKAESEPVIPLKVTKD